MTTLLPPNVKVHLALGYIDMRKGIDGLAILVQEVLRQDPFTGHLFVFRGRTRANLIKIVFWDGTGLCLFTKRLVFSAWWVVPQVIATLVSYEAERRMVRTSGRARRNTSEARRRVRPLLRFQRELGFSSLGHAVIFSAPVIFRVAPGCAQPSGFFHPV